MLKFINNLGLKVKLLLMMMTLCIISIGLLFISYNIAEKMLIASVKSYTEELSSAIQISVEQLTDEDNVGVGELLKEHVSRFNKKGIREISILNNDMEVIASSNSKKIGQQMDKKKMLAGSHGIENYNIAQTENLKGHDIILPVVVGYEQLGYIHISMLFDDFSDILMANNQKRLIVTGIVFAVGIAMSLFLSMKYVKPIKELAAATRKIASGVMDEIPELESRDEIGELTRNFNEMVKGLRENKQLEQRLQAAEHLSSIGQLASGIAHEIRNPLNLINLSIDHIKNEYTPQDNGQSKEFKLLISNIKAEINKLNSMIGKFLSYGKPITLKIERTYIEDVIKDVLVLAEFRIREQLIELKTNFFKDLPKVNIDRHQINACFMNIILNAIQAMPTGGILSVSTVLTNGFVVTKIEDSGEGISEEHLLKIFEPYFTTKQTGIGLGLSLTKRVIDEHKGSIEVKSRQGQGTSVSVALPI